MSLKPSNGSEPDGSDMEPGPWSGEGSHSSSQHLQQGQDAEHQGNGNRGNVILATQTMLAKASTAQSRERHMQSLAGQTPILLCTCTAGWCSNICHAVPPLPRSTPPSPPAFLPFPWAPSDAHTQPSRNTPWARQRLGILSAQTSHAVRGASCISPEPQPACPPCSASRSSAWVAPTEERVTHCRVTLLLWMAGKTSEWLLILLERPGGLRARVSICKHRRTLAPLHSYLHSSPLLNLVHAWTCPFTTPAELKARTWNIRGPTKTSLLS